MTMHKFSGILLVLTVLLFYYYPSSIAQEPITPPVSESQPISTQSMGARTSNFVGQGFDKCEIPSLSQLQTWMTDSPYKAVNLYIGGSRRACANGVLSAAYVSQMSRQGWKFIPTWVGPQTTCYGGSPSISNDPTTAYNQGVSEANAAITVANNLGLTLPDKSGTIIYYDLEMTGDATCRDAAKSFISGWVGQLHALGNQAGVYGASCGATISDFASISNIPDAIWPAAWYWPTGQGHYEPSATVWDVSCLSNGLWSSHQRIRQYAGGHSETWGGVTLTIDSNVIDGITAFVPLPNGQSDYNGDGKPDLFAINKLGGSGKTDVHILNGADAFQSFLAHEATVLAPTGNDSTWMFNLGDYNGDGKPDLFAINRLGGSGKTDVHILNGADGFQTFLAHIATAQDPTGSDCTWVFPKGHCIFSIPTPYTFLPIILKR